MPPAPGPLPEKFSRCSNFSTLPQGEGPIQLEPIILYAKGLRSAARRKPLMVR
jgi:hypothetical protein